MLKRPCHKRLLRASLFAMGLTLAPVAGAQSNSEHRNPPPSQPSFDTKAFAAEQARSRAASTLRPGFTSLPQGAKVAMLPPDVELFEISAGGVMTPMAQWTEKAQGFIEADLQQRLKTSELAAVTLSDAQQDAFADQQHLLRAISSAIALHHNARADARDVWKLQSKAKGLEWDAGDAFVKLAEASGARYLLYTHIRDSYASTERKAVMVGLAFIGAVIPGGQQFCRSLLLDMQTGEVLWANATGSLKGDLREREPAAETMARLMLGWPGTAPADPASTAASPPAAAAPAAPAAAQTPAQ